MGRDPVRQAVLRYAAIGIAAIVLISLLGVWFFRRAGETEAIRDAKDQTRIAAEGSVEPVLSDRLLRGDPRALDALDRVVEERVKAEPSIARELGISEKTVKTHLTRVFQQLGVSDRTQAALWAKEHGL